MVKFITIFIILITSASLAEIKDTLLFEIDMSVPIANGWFDVNNETVGIRGDQRPLSWGKTFSASEFDGKSKYLVKVPFNQINDSLMLSFKIKVDGTNNPDDGWQRGQNQQTFIYHNKKNVVNLKWENIPLPESTMTGNIQVIKNFESSPLQETRNLYIYLPPDYHDSDKLYPVLYMHDGQNIFEASSIGQEWQMDETAEKLIKSDEIEPMIIVGISNTKNRIEEYTPTKQTWNHVLKKQELSTTLSGEWIDEVGNSINFREKDDEVEVQISGSDFWQSLIIQNESFFYLPEANITFKIHRNSDGNISSINADKPAMGGNGNLYGEFLVNSLIPYIDKHYRTKSGKEYTALGGSSLGGLISLYLGLKYSDTFGYLLVVSPSVWWDERFIIKYVNSLNTCTDQYIWMDMGTAESKGAVESLEDLMNALLAKGWQEPQIDFHIYKNAAHNEHSWAKRVPDMLRFLFK